MDGDAYDALAIQLDEGEELLWAGQPRQGLILRGSDAFVIPFSIMWGGFALLWEGAVITVGDPVFILWGIPFVLIGLYLMIGRFFVDAKQRTKVYYGVTRDRIIIRSGLFRETIKSLNLDTLSDMTLRERSDGVGTLTFGPMHPMYAWTGNTPWPGMGMHATPAFQDIPEARAVYTVIRDAQRAIRGRLQPTGQEQDDDQANRDRRR